MPVNYINNLDQLLRVLNSCDSWTQLDNSFYCLRGGMQAILVWVGEITEADLVAP